MSHNVSGVSVHVRACVYVCVYTGTKLIIIMSMCKFGICVRVCMRVYLLQSVFGVCFRKRVLACVRVYVCVCMCMCDVCQDVSGTCVCEFTRISLEFC